MSTMAVYKTTHAYVALPFGSGFAALTGLLQSWRYDGGKRDLRLDLLRGFAALAMIADHIGNGESWLTPITGGNRFLVSAAEVFVFISGALVGIVYGKLMLKNGAMAGVLKALKRAFKLYLLTIALTLGFAVIGAELDLWWQPVLAEGQLLAYVTGVITFQQTIFLVDIPLVYTLLLLIAAPALLLLSRGQTLALLAISWLIWGIWQVAPGSIGWHIADSMVFNMASWQVIFVTAMAIGYHRDAIAAWIARLSSLTIGVTLGFAAVAVLFLYILQLTELQALRADPLLYDFAFDKPNVPAGRLLALVLFGAFAYALLSLAWRPIRLLTGWLLLPLGQNALTAYSLHLLVVAATTWLTWSVLDGEPSIAAGTALQVAGVFAVWLVVRFEPGLRSRMIAARPSPLAKATSAWYECQADSSPQSPLTRAKKVHVGVGLALPRPWGTRKGMPLRVRAFLSPLMPTGP